MGIDYHPTIDPQTFRSALGHYASGVTVIATLDDKGPAGFTCQAFHSVSVEPPLVSFCVMKRSTSFPRILNARRFSVNVLSAGQHRIADQLACTGSNKWANVVWRPTSNGNPIIEGTILWLDCDIRATYEAGDHLIVIGSVNELGPQAPTEPAPLLFFNGEYRKLHGPTT